jgi:hypothetical protein
LVVSASCAAFNGIAPARANVMNAVLANAAIDLRRRGVMAYRPF